VKLTRVILLIALGALLASCGNSGTSSGVENLRAPGVVPFELVNRNGADVEICYVVDKAPALFYSVMEGSTHRVDFQVTVYSTPENALDFEGISKDGMSVRFFHVTSIDDDSFCADDDRNESLGPVNGCKYKTSAGSHPITKGRHLLAGYKANGPEAARVKSGAYAADYEVSMADGFVIASDLRALSETTYTDENGALVTWSKATLSSRGTHTVFDTLEDPDLEEGREIVRYRTDIDVFSYFGPDPKVVPMCGGDALPTGTLTAATGTYRTETFVWIDDYVDKTIGQDQPCAKDSAGECL